MEKSKIDVAVLLLFFTRTAHTVKTFEQIRRARPARLYLYQDGPRINHPDDERKIKECRAAIESMIDWECEVYRNYQIHNAGCDPSNFNAQKWMFKTESKGIILEDDDVMSISFFRFCKEMLDRYEDDQRISMISGMNHLGEYYAGGADYIFANSGSIWGWATWRRVIDEWDGNYNFLNDEYATSCLRRVLGKKKYNSFRKRCLRHLSSGREHYETILAANFYLNNRLNIVPTKNLTCNIGISLESTHSVSDISLLPRSVRKVLFMKTYEYEGEFVHPKYIVEDKMYEERLDILRHGSFISRVLRLRKLEGLLYRLLPFLGRIGCKETMDRVKHFNLSE